MSKNTYVVMEEVDRARTARYKVKGCEKTILVGGSGAFNLQIEAVSQSDPHFTPIPLITITNSQIHCLDQFPCVSCGMDLIFKTDSTIDPNAHLFVEIGYETCTPEKCCC